MPIDGTRPLHVSAQSLEQPFLLARSHAHDPALIDHQIEVQGLPAGHRVGAYHRVGDLTVGAIRHAAPPEPALKLLRQGLVGGTSVNKQRVPTFVRQLPRAEQRHARGFTARQAVGVPVVRGGILRAGERHNLGVVGQSHLRRIGLDPAKAPAEPHVLGGREPLVAEEQYVVGLERRDDLRPFRFVDRPSDVDADKLGAELLTQLNDDCHTGDRQPREMDGRRRLMWASNPADPGP